MKFEELQKVEATVKQPNLWSYAGIIGSIKILLEDKVKGVTVAEEKRRLLEYIIKQADIHDNKIYEMLKNVEAALKGSGYELRRARIKAIYRGLVGGSETFGEIPFEVGLYFDPILNVPYIPGSTIKGAVRAGVFDLLLKRKDSKEEAERKCRGLFGDNEGAGLIGFTDAYPVEKGEKGYLLYPDVMSPHYKSDTATELDVSPTPIIYLTIAPGTKFQFYIFYRRERGSGKKKRSLTIMNSQNADISESPTQDLSKLGILDQGLLYSFYRGVGAKTSVGYSRFEVISYERV